MAYIVMGLSSHGLYIGLYSYGMYRYAEIGDQDTIAIKRKSQLARPHAAALTAWATSRIDVMLEAMAITT